MWFSKQVGVRDLSSQVRYDDSSFSCNKACSKYRTRSTTTTKYTLTQRLVFLTLPYPVPAPKNYVIFIGCNFKSRASQAGLHKEKKDTASAKKGKVRLQHRGGRRLKAVL